MARYKPTAGFEFFTGALSKKKGQKHLLVTRLKHVKDPITGKVVGLGPKEVYAQEPRDLTRHPLKEGEKRQRERWRAACKEAAAIVRDKSHPRYMEMYQRWCAQLSDEGVMQFPNFVRSVLVKE